MFWGDLPIRASCAVELLGVSGYAQSCVLYGFLCELTEDLEQGDKDGAPDHILLQTFHSWRLMALRTHSGPVMAFAVTIANIHHLFTRSAFPPSYFLSAIIFRLYTFVDIP
jgi:hypothetical protein